MRKGAGWQQLAGLRREDRADRLSRARIETGGLSGSQSRPAPLVRGVSKRVLCHWFHQRVCGEIGHRLRLAEQVVIHNQTYKGYALLDDTGLTEKGSCRAVAI